MRRNNLRPAWLSVLGVFVLAGCVSSDPAALPPDLRYGHRYEREGPDGRLTMHITAPEPGRLYFRYPVPMDSAYVRSGPFSTTPPDSGSTTAEVLLKGTLPDACSDLDSVGYEKSGHLIRMSVIMRRPQGAVCAAISRPFRLYVDFEEPFAAGSYTLKIDDVVFPFEIRPPEVRR